MINYWRPRSRFQIQPMEHDEKRQSSPNMEEISPPMTSIILRVKQVPVYFYNLSLKKLNHSHVVLNYGQMNVFSKPMNKLARDL
jgi:hypothetical protein